MNYSYEHVKSIIKQLIIDKIPFSVIDTNGNLDYLKCLYKPYSIDNNFEHITKSDMDYIFNFYITNQLPIFNFDPINKEIAKKMPKLIYDGVLSNESIHELEQLKCKLNYTELQIPTSEELDFSESNRWRRMSFSRPDKDCKTDLLIYIMAKNRNVKIIITSDGDFDWCIEKYNEIYPNNSEDVIIITPAEFVKIIEELKKEGVI